MGPLHSSFPEDMDTCSGHQIQVTPAASTKVEKGIPKFYRKILLKFQTITAPWLQGAQAEVGPCAAGEWAGGSARGLLSAALVPQGGLAESRESMGVMPESVSTRVQP